VHIVAHVFSPPILRNEKLVEFNITIKPVIVKVLSSIYIDSCVVISQPGVARQRVGAPGRADLLVRVKAIS
jgi:hypothetical protein